MLKLNLDLILIIKNKLNINEYLSLFKIYLINKDTKDFSFINNFIIYPDDYESLIKKGFISTSMFDKSGYTLSESGSRLFFNSSDSYFEEFYNMYPSKIPTGLQGYRVVSNQDINTAGANKTKRLWKNITKDNVEFQKKIINCLKTELNNRELGGSLGYLSNIDNWLENRNWEKWENLPNSNTESKTNVKKL